MNSRQQKSFTVDVRADPLTEVFVIGNQYRLLGRGIGGLNLQLPHGRYIVKYRRGAETLQAPLLVRDNVELNVGQGNDPGQSTGWLDKSTPDFVSSFFEVAKPMVWPGPEQGSLSLFLYDEEYELGSRINLTLRDLTGRQIELESEEYRTKHAWGVRLNLEPGTYTLRSNSKHIGNHEMSVYVGNQSQTVVSLTNRTISEISKGRRAIDLGLTSVQIGNRDGGEMIAPGRAMELWAITDVMRDALAFRRNTLAPQELTQALYEKFGCPLMGLLGAHLLLLNDKLDSDLLTVVVNNMETLMPGSPDVAAIRMALNRRTNRRVKPPKITVPPMLEASWQEILRADHRFPGTIKLSAFPSGIVPTLTAASPWLIWSTRSRIALPNQDFALAATSDFGEYVSVLSKRKKGRVYQYDQDRRVEEIATKLMVPKIQVVRSIKSARSLPKGIFKRVRI